MLAEFDDLPNFVGFDRRASWGFPRAYQGKPLGAFDADASDSVKPAAREIC